ncbi:MAG: hypothetical protein WC254_05135 [Candidatus Woesearchaeota archaeon]|jgi:hypothetical protein
MAKKQQQRDDFFISITDPSLVRRNILESSQQIVEGMKSYEKYKKIKLEKLKKIDELKQLLVVIKENTFKLRAYLPTVKETVQEKEQRTPNITLLELEQLNSEIRKLETDLNIK